MIISDARSANYGNTVDNNLTDTGEYRGARLLTTRF